MTGTQQEGANSKDAEGSSVGSPGPEDEFQDAKSDTSETVEIVLASRRRRASDDEESDQEEGQLQDEAKEEDEADDASSTAEVVASHQIADFEVSEEDSEGKTESGETEEGEIVEKAEDGSVEQEQQGGKGRRKLEPFEVPTAGPFYMHDDRFGEEPPPPTRQPQQQATRRLADPADQGDRWVHDRYEENDQDPVEYPQRYGPGRGRSDFRGRGRGRRYGSRGSGAAYEGRPGGRNEYGPPSNEDQDDAANLREATYRSASSVEQPPPVNTRSGLTQRGRGRSGSGRRGGRSQPPAFETAVPSSSNTAGRGRGRSSTARSERERSNVDERDYEHAKQLNVTAASFFPDPKSSTQQRDTSAKGQAVPTSPHPPEQKANFQTSDQPAAEQGNGRTGAEQNKAKGRRYSAKAGNLAST